MKALEESLLSKSNSEKSINSVDLDKDLIDVDVNVTSPQLKVNVSKISNNKNNLTVLSTTYSSDQKQ